MSDQTVGKADLHVHTSASDGMHSAQQVLDYVEERTDLDVIAVTDHDDPAGAFEAREVWARGRYRFEVVPGIEVTAIEGHVIALFVEEPLPALRPVEEVLEAIHRQGGLAIAAHPFNWLTRSLNQRSLERIAASQREGVYLDGMETAKAAPGARVGVGKAAAFNREHYGVADIGSSDAHFLSTIGSAYTEFAGRTAEELRQSILERSCRSVNGGHPSLMEIGPWQLARQAVRGILTTPRRLGWGPTTGSFFRRTFGPR